MPFQAVITVICAAFLLLMPLQAAAAPALPVPTGATAVTQSGFDATWGTVPGASGYQLDVAVNAQFSSFVSSYASRDVGNVTSFNVSGLTAGTPYFYRVRSYDGSGASQNSTISAVVTLPAIPAVPVVGSASAISQNAFTAVWSSAAGASGYQLDVALDPAFSSLVTGFSARDVGNVTSMAVTGLTSNTTYFYRVRAYNAGGMTQSSASSATTTLLDVPAIPIASGAQSITATGFNATWALSATATGYRLDVSANPGFTTFVTGYNNKDVGNVSLADVAGLTTGTTYYYRVRAYNAGGTSASSAVWALVTQNAAVGQPLALNPASISQNGFTAAWNDIAPATAIELDVATDPLFTTNVSGYQSRLLPYATSFPVSGLNPGTVYYYRVRGNDSGVSGLNSTVIAVVTLPATSSVPVAGIAGSVTSSGFTAVWGAASGSAGYRLDVASDSGFVSLVPGYANRDVGSVTGFAVGGLNPASAYYYRVRSYNNGGTSISSNSIAVVTLPAIPAVPQPAVPQSITQTSFTAVWSAVPGADGYRLDVSASPTFATFVSGNNNRDTATVTSAVVSGLTAGTVYYYRVRAYSSGGTSASSPIGAAVTLPATPAVPLATSPAAITTSSFNATWAAASGATGYYLDVATDSGFASMVPGNANRDVGLVISAAVTGLVDGTTYYYRVRSYNNGGISASSGTVSTATLPLAPVATNATLVGQAGFTANWGSVGGATSYRLDVASDVTFNTILASYNNKSITGTSAAVTGLNAGITYYYRVRGVTAGGSGANSNVVTLVTLGTPVAVAATAVSQNGFTANWNAVAGASGYWLDVSASSTFGSFVIQNLSMGSLTSYAVSGLTAGTTYYYRVRADNGMSTSANSNTITQATLGIPVATAATAISQTGFSATWNAAPAAVGYRLDVASDSAFTSILPAYDNLDAGLVTSYAVSGLTPGATYYYRVRAYTSSATSSNSNSSTVTTLATPIATAATALTQTGFNANWGSVVGASGYRLDVSVDPTFTANLSTYDNKDVKAVTSYAVTGLTAGTTYYYRVRAYNATSTTTSSNSISLTTVPPNPVATTATMVFQTGITANWSPSPSASGYRLDVATNSTFTIMVTGYNDLDTGTNTSVAVTGLMPGTTYYYRVRAYNAAGISGSSNTIIQSTLATPVAIAATAVTQTGFTANWNTAAGASGYLLEVASDLAFTALIPAYNGVDVGNFTSLIITGLSPGVTYYYRVKAYTPVATTGYSNAISQITLATPVAAAATTITQNGFRASWGAVSGASGYRLDVALDAGFASLVPGYDDKNVLAVTNYTVTGLNPGTTYYYRVRSYNNTVTSTSSNVVSFVTVPPAPVLTTPTVVTQTGFTVNWVAAQAATGYQLDVSTSSTFTVPVTGYSNLDVGNVTSRVVSGLSVGVTYYIRLRAYNGSGISANSATVSQSTLTTPVATAATTITQISFIATWQVAGGASGYRLDVASDSLFQTMVPGYDNLDVGNTTSQSVGGLSPGVTYYYRVRSYTSAAVTGNSNVISQITLATPVATLATVVTQTSFKATWQAVSGASGYRLDVAIDPGFTSMLPNYDDKNVLNVTSYAVSGLSTGVTYYYRVRAYNATATTVNSNVISPTTFPSVPVGGAATMVTQTSFVANWNYAIGASGYRLDVSTNSAFATFVDGYNDADVGNVITYPITSLTPGVTYYYRIRAYNIGGTSTNSVPSITQATIPPAPVATAATTITQTGFKATWIAATGAASYLLDVALDNGFTTILATYASLDVKNVTSYAVSGLEPGTTYYYRIRAINSGGTSPNSNTITQATMATPVAAAATLVTSTGFTANWGFVNGATSYRLDVSTSSVFSTFVNGYKDRDVANVLSFAVTGLNPGSGYYYRVRAVNAGVTSLDSNTIMQATLGIPVAAPATAITQTGFTANWNTTSAANGYLLEVATDAAFANILPPFATGGLDVGAVTSYAVQNISPGTTYHYRVRAYSSGGSSSNSATITLTTLPPTPLAPTSAPASGVTQYAFTANWFTVSGATGYRLDLSTDPAFASYVSGYFNRDVGNVSSHAISGLLAGTTYYYRVRAFNSGGTSASSVAVSQTTLPPTPPDPPVAASATAVTPTGFTASWSAVIGATGYVIDVSLDQAFNSLVESYTNLDVGNVVTTAVSGLTSGTVHYYRVRAYNLAGTSPVSNTVTVTVKPAAPQLIVNSVAAAGFSLSWGAVSGATGYLVDVATDATFSSLVPTYSGKDVGAAVSVAISGLNAGSSYYCRVRAYNAGGSGLNSNIVNSATLPAAPTNLSAAMVTRTSFNLNWNIVSGADGYRVDVALDPAFTSFVNGFSDLNVGNVTTVAVSGLSAGTTYYLRVRAYTSGGIGASSITGVQATLPPPPAAPLAVSAPASTAGSFTANWGAVYGATGYRIDVSTMADFSSFVVGYFNYDVGSVTSYEVIGLTPGASYYYRVRAYNTGGDGEVSNSIAVTVASAVLTVSVSGEGSVNSTPSGISCVAGATSNCSALFDGGIPVELTATPSAGSVFGGWSGSCQGSGICSLVMDSDRSVSASFVQIRPVRIADAQSPRFYDTLQAAYADAVDNDVILLTDGVLAGDLIANRPISLSIIGGFDATYSANTLETVLQGIVRIQQGVVRMEKVRVRM